MRKNLVSVCAMALLALGGCSSNDRNWGDYFEMLRQSISASFGKQLISRDQAGAVPYASMAYRADGSSEAMLVLATETNGNLLWTAASRVVLLTNGGRVLRSIGLPHNREATVATSPEGFPPIAAALKSAYTSTRIVDMPELGAYSVTLICTAMPVGPRMIRILGMALATVQVNESCRGNNSPWKFTDTYWLDPETGFPWQSRQHLTPKGPVLEIRILRPPE